LANCPVLLCGWSCQPAEIMLSAMDGSDGRNHFFAGAHSI
jgi:hypothetical protein